MDLWPRDQIRNDDIRERLEVAPVEEKLVQYRLRWFEHMQRRPVETPIRNGVIRRTGNKKRRKVSKWFYDTFIGAATRAAHCDSFVGEGFGLLVASY
jgi:hypothetical protein